MNVCKLGLSIAMLLSGGMAFAQGTVDDYNRAYALREIFSANKVFYSNVTPQWIEGTHQFWYVRNTPEGRIYVSVNADKKNRKEYSNADNAMIKVFNSMPAWKPGICNGKKVNVLLTQRINVHLE